MAVRNHFHNAKAGVESPVTKKLSGIRLLFADLKFMRRTHYIMQFYRIHLCVLLTKQDFHFTNMHDEMQAESPVCNSRLQFCNYHCTFCN